MSKFNKITSVESKFGTLNQFYKEFKKLRGVKIKYDNTKHKKITVLKTASMLYDVLVTDYRKDYNQIFKSKDKDWSLNNYYKNLKHLDYQPDQLQPDQ